MRTRRSNPERFDQLLAQFAFVFSNSPRMPAVVAVTFGASFNLQVFKKCLERFAERRARLVTHFRVKIGSGHVETSNRAFHNLTLTLAGEASSL